MITYVRKQIFLCMYLYTFRGGGRGEGVNSQIRILKTGESVKDNSCQQPTCRSMCRNLYLKLKL